MARAETHTSPFPCYGPGCCRSPVRPSLPPHNQTLHQADQVPEINAFISALFMTTRWRGRTVTSWSGSGRRWSAQTTCPPSGIGDSRVTAAWGTAEALRAHPATRRVLHRTGYNFLRGSRAPDSSSSRLVQALIGLLIACGSCALVAALSPPLSEQSALGDLYSATAGASWTSNVGWLASGAVTCGVAVGVTCDGAGSVMYVLS